jgi:nitrate reductase cytochrome c-type subunit
VLVVLIGGVGVTYLVTHEDPHFCNFICHTPMDKYVESYDNNIPVAATKTTFNGTLGVVLHKDADVNCLKCHVPTMSEQINEGIHWLTGDYELDEDGSLSNIKLVTPSNKELKEGETDGVAFCLREGCHTEKTLADLEAATASEKRNPHTMPHGKVDCYQCHKMHEASTNYCVSCHSDAPKMKGE